MNQPLFKPLYLPGADEKKLNPTWQQTMQSAFGLENDVVNMYDYLTRSTFAPDPEFNFKETFKAAKLPTEWMPLLAPAQSRMEFDATLGRVQKEYQDKAVLAASGWGGTVAALAAGMLSPTVFIPFAGQGRGVAGMAEVLALAAAGSTATNAALFLNQETRTEAELYAGIAMDTLLMGMMGGAYLGLTGRTRTDLARSIPFNENFSTVPEGASDVPSGNQIIIPNTEAPPRLPEVDEIRSRILRDFEGVKPEDVNEDFWNGLTEGGYLADEYAAAGIRTVDDARRIAEDPNSYELTPEGAAAYLRAQARPAEWNPDTIIDAPMVQYGPTFNSVVKNINEELSTYRIMREGISELPDNIFQQRRVREDNEDFENALDESARRMVPSLEEIRTILKEQEGLTDLDVERIMREVKDSDPNEFLAAVADSQDPMRALEYFIGGLLAKVDWTARAKAGQAESAAARIADLEAQARLIETKAAEYGMAPVTGKAAIPEPDAARTTDSTASVGAAVTRTRNTLGAKAAPNRARQVALDALGRMSPAYRMLTNRFFPSLRNGIAKLDTAGIQQAGLENMQPSAVGGTVIERIRGYDPYIVALAKALDRNFLNYIYDGAKGIDFDSPAIAQIKSEFGKTPPGKLNWTQYKETVFDQLNTGEIEPQFADSVAAFKEFFENYTTRQKQYLDEFKAQGMEVDPLFREIDGDELGKGVENYAHHIFDQNALMDRVSEFLDDFSKAYERQLTEAFKAGQKRYVKRKANLEFEKLISTMDESEIGARLQETEADIEAIEEIPEMQMWREARLQITRQSREEGWPKERLKEALAQLQEGQAVEVRALADERKQLASVARALKKFGGDSGEKTAKLQADIAKLDEAISGMFRTEIPAIERADLSIGRLQAKGDKALAPIEKSMKNVVKQLQKRNASIIKMLGSKRMNSASRAKAMEQLEKTKQRYADLETRLSAAQGQQVAIDQRLRELQLVREEAIREANLIVRSRASRLEDLEDKLEAIKTKPLTPEERARMGAQVDEEIWKLEQDFQDLWGGRRGEQSGMGPDAEVPDFKEKALEMATLLHQKLTNSEVELSPAYHALRQDARGAELLRVMKMPYDMKSKWLIKDVELVSRAYDRVMAPDLEIWRAFDGSVNAKSLLGEMQQEVTEHMMRIGTAKFVKLPKGWVDKAAKFSDRVAKRITEAGEADDLYLSPSNFSDEAKEGFVELTEDLRSQLGRAVTDAAKQYTNDLDVAIQRLRNTRGVPRDASSMWWRTGRAVKNLNVLTMMGGVLPASISDVARPIWQHGVRKAFAHGFKPFINGLTKGGKEFRIKAKEINRQIGLNLEPVLHGRAQGLFDLAEDSIGKTKAERALNVGAQKMGLIALYDYWTAGMKGIAGNITHATMATYVPAVAKAWRENAEFTGDLLEMRTYLRNLGLSDMDIHRIGLQMERADGVEYFSNGGVLPNLKAWDDPAAYQAYQAAVLNEVNKLIVTPGLERPNVVDENMAYSMLFQFKSFVFASNSRMAMSALQGNDPYLGQGIAFSLAFGALSYYTYAMFAGGKTAERMQEADLDEWIWEAVKRSGLMGAASIGGDIFDKVPLLGGGTDSPLMFTKPSGLLGTILGPTYSQADRMAEVIMKSKRPEGTSDTEWAKQVERNMKGIRQTFIPFQNHFLFRQALDRIGEALYGAN